MKTSRRELIGILAAAAGASGAPKYTPKLSAQFYVWTQQFGREKKSLPQGIPEALAATKRAGFKDIELVSWIFTPQLRDTTIASMKVNGLNASVVYSGAKLDEQAAAEKAIANVLALADVVKPLGTEVIDVNPDPKPKRERKTDDELRIQAENVRRLEKELRGRGLKLALHHHDPEMAENAREWRHLLMNTEAPLIMDMHWVLRGGQDPLALVKEAGRRVLGLHLRNSKNNVWTEALGDGDIDYRAVASHLKKTGFTGYLIVELAYQNETQITRPLEENLRLSREYAQQVFKA